MVIMKMDDNASGAIPLILYILGIVTSGALYTMLFIVVFYKTFVDLIPDSSFKTVIVWGILYFAPLIVIVVGIIALIQEAQRDTALWEVK